jgi:hypothetical protein
VAVAKGAGDNARMNVPITVSCQCGRTSQAFAGQEVTCDCGRRYATTLSTQQVAALNGLQTQMRIFARLGTGLVGLTALLGFLLIDRWAGLAALIAAGVLWWGVLQPIWRRHAVARLASLPPASVSPK